MADVASAAESVLDPDDEFHPLALVAHLPLGQLEARRLGVGAIAAVLDLPGEPEENRARPGCETQVMRLPVHLALVDECAVEILEPRRGDVKLRREFLQECDRVGLPVGSALDRPGKKHERPVDGCDLGWHKEATAHVTPPPPSSFAPPPPLAFWPPRRCSDR